MSGFVKTFSGGADTRHFVVTSCEESRKGEYVYEQKNERAVVQ